MIFLLANGGFPGSIGDATLVVHLNWIATVEDKQYDKLIDKDEEPCGVLILAVTAVSFGFMLGMIVH